MESADSFFIVTVALTFFVAGLVKGVTGMGLPTVAMGLLGMLMPPLTAAALLIVPSFVTNVWQLLAGPHLLRIARRLWSMLAAATVATIAGASLIASGSAAPTMALGAALMVYAAHALLTRPIRVPAAAEAWLSPAVGGVTGIVTGGTGVFVIPAVPYLQGLGLEKDDLVQALGLSFTVSTMALAAGLAWRSELATSHLTASTLAVAPALAGMAVGQAIRSRMSAARFHRWFLVCLLLLGTGMIVKPLL